MAKIKVLFLSAQPVVLSSLTNFFSDCPFFISGFDDYSNFDNDLINSDWLKYNVIIFDDGSLERQEIEKIGNFMANINHIKKILFSGHFEKQYFLYFIQNGIDGILSKKENLENLNEAIFSVMENRKYYSSPILECILQDEQNKDEIKILTNREKEIISFSRKGLQNKEIAQKLCLSVKTIENHKQNIKNKLGLTTSKKLKELKIPL
ncbi:MAG: response regulator transcription factor [Ignavibacteriaceae bacterium]|nr:response regulator transcription factor [Ignavibacteriaceae bacterium]